MVNIRAIFQAIIDGVHALTPATWPDRNFSFEPNSLLKKPDEWIASQSRSFRDCCLYLSGYPLSTNAYCYSSLFLELMIFYPLSIATDELQALMIEDAIAIQNAIGRHPETWGGADSITFLGQQPYEFETLTDDNGDSIAIVFSVPMEVVIRP